MASGYVNLPVPAANGASVISINGDTTAAQLIVPGSSGADLGIATSGGITTVSIPSASASARGLLTSANWTSFNNKQALVARVNKTANYTITSVDTLVTADATGGAFTLTLPDPAAVTGIPIRIEKYDTGFNVVSIARHGSEKINNVAADTSLNTYLENITIISDGVDYWITDRNYYRGWTAFSMNVDSTGTDPAYPVSPTLNASFWRREGRDIIIKHDYQGIDGTTGTGTYLWEIPNAAGWTIDSSQQTISTTLMQGRCGHANVFQFDNFQNIVVMVQAYDTTHVALGNFTHDEFTTAGNTPLGSGNITALSFEARVPITQLN